MRTRSCSRISISLLALATFAPLRGSEVVSVSAASFRPGAVAPESIVAAFGEMRAVATQSATSLPLPTLLGGLRVTVRDSAGVERAAPLFFVSGTQINYLVPAGTQAGLAEVTVTGDRHRISGSLSVEDTAPALFSADSSGQGVAAAIATRIRDGARTLESVFRMDPSHNRVVAVPLDLGRETDQVVLSLFGTGFRAVGPHPSVAVQIAGESAEVLSAGPQPDFAGLDQVNVRLSRRLIGRGEVTVLLTLGSKTSNPVTVTIR